MSDPQVVVTVEDLTALQFGVNVTFVLIMSILVFCKLVL